MSATIQIEIRENHFSLYHDKAVYWHEERALLLADLHAGKANHFRKNGIPISSDYLLNDLNRIEELAIKSKAQQLIVLGDLFHSYHNTENHFVVEWIKELGLPFTLVKGNHDLYTPIYDGIVELDELNVSNIRLVHDPYEEESELFQIGGHIHPGYRIKGKAKQSMRFPCYFIGEKHMVLPSFGSLTGSVNMKRGDTDKVILVSPDGLIAL